MKKVKNFINEKKRNIKFANAGTGKTLNDNNNIKILSNSGPDIDPIIQGYNSLKRSDKDSTTHGHSVNVNDKNIYFTCNHIDIPPFPFEQMLEKLRQFLLSEFSLHPLYFSTIIIKTLNNPTTSQQCIDVLTKYIENIGRDYNNPRYRAIRCNNKIFNDKVTPVEGAKEFLIAFGFESHLMPANFYQLDDINLQLRLLKTQKNDDQNTEEELYYLFNLEEGQNLEDKIKVALSILENTKKMEWELYRNERLYYFISESPKFEPPNQFYKHKLEDVKMIYKDMKNRVDKDLLLRTRAMKLAELPDKDFNTKLDHELCDQCYTFIRIKFPNNLILQGTFEVEEKISKVIDFISQYLTNNKNKTGKNSDGGFLLLTSWGLKLYPFVSNTNNPHNIPATKLKNPNPKDDTLKNLNLIPTASLIFQPLDSSFDQTVDEFHRYLVPNILKRLQIL
ncbi:UBX domain-containing protein 6-like isoform X2 [Gordionus sp. m RMFG-2023]|uniref:UBX domain-containing protein 6-like isoform X2 n=1 Tax=Gordionus sp. m RMFG-2023 TaxID=3053472 RepID=UPI0031FD7C06